MGVMFTAEEYFDLYLKTLNPFGVRLSNFECLRVKLLIRRKLEDDINKDYLYILDAYMDILLGKKEINPFNARFLVQKSNQGDGLSAYLVYYCFKKRIQPFTNSAYEDYIYIAAENNFTLAYEEVANLFIINKSKLSLEETINYVNKIDNSLLKELYLACLKVNKDNIQFDDSSFFDKPFCYYILGKMYEEGIIFNADIEKATDYYIKGANLKDIYSINRLAYIYQNGLTGAVNIQKALYYYNCGSKVDSNNIINLMSLKVETQELSEKDLNLMIIALKKINNEKASILLGQIYLKYPLLKKEKEGIYLISFYALTNPRLYYDLYVYYSNIGNRKEAIRNLRRGVVKKDSRCIEEAKCYKKLSSLLH